MDRRPGGGAAKVSNVSSGLDLRTPETVNVTNSNQNSNRESTNDGVADEKAAPDEGACDQVPNCSPDRDAVLPSSGKRKRRLSEPEESTSALENSRPKRQRHSFELGSLNSPESNEEQRETAILRTVPEKMRKYFAQRHRLFHRYDEGIQLDEEAWYSVTPEKIASHIASRFAHLKVVVDLYSCVGGNSIQFAKAGLRVIAVEIDQLKIDMAINNAAVYGVQNNIEFRKGDVFEVLSSLKDEFESDWGVFLSPPWGGPGYLNLEVFDVSVFKSAIDTAKALSDNVAILVPRNISNKNVFENFGRCEVEENYLGGKLKTKTLYFGNLEGKGAAVDDAEYE